MSAYDLLPADEREAIAWVREHGGIDHVRAEWRSRVPPVLAADGEPLEVGQTVWLVDSFGRPNEEREVSEILRHNRDLSCTIIKFTDGYSTDCGNVTHERPVLDADGVPIREGDTVYLLPGEWCDEWPCLGFHGGEELEVFADGEARHVPGGVQCREMEKKVGFRGTCYPQPSQLTHTNPEPSDSWDALWDDIEECAVGYEGFMRRCRALAERERGEA